MKFTYAPLEGMQDNLTKYGIDFSKGKMVDVDDLTIASKLQQSPYMDVFAEVESEPVKPKRTRRTPEQMKEAKALEDASK